MYTYEIAADLNDDGDYADQGETLTPFVLKLAWRIGFTQPYTSVAPHAEARITLDNRLGIFSPERFPTQQYIGKTLRIRAGDTSNMRTLFTGMIRQLEPHAGAYGEQIAVMTVSTLDADLPVLRAALPALVNARADTLIAELFKMLPQRRPALHTLWLLGVATYTELGSTTALAGDSVTLALETGISTFAYAAFDLDQPADDAVRRIVEAERGRFFADRLGRLAFHNRHHVLFGGTPAASLDDNMAGLRYDYAGGVNQVRVMAIPRSVGAAGTALWTLNSPQRLPPGVHRLVAPFRDSAGKSIGAVAVSSLAFSANTQPNGSGSPVAVTGTIMRIGASSAELEFRNDTAQVAYIQAGAALYGTPLYGGDPLIVEKLDQVSMSLYGVLPLGLTLPLVNTVEDADQIARFELRRRPNPLGDALSLTLDVRDQPPPVLFTPPLDCTLFDRIAIHETQTGHSADYWIIGEANEVDMGGARHFVTWTLERADPTRYWLIGSGVLDTGTALAY
jgi:hypothetical protein